MDVLSVASHLLCGTQTVEWRMPKQKELGLRPVRDAAGSVKMVQVEIP